MANNPTNQALSVTFWGAARTVTGSMHLVDFQGRKLLLDCGLYQGKRAEARQRNSQFPCAPGTIDAVVLSHAHIDHSGNLPNLVRHGFAGPIYCTPATADLAAVLLADSAKIQEEDADYLNKTRPPGQPKIEPLYCTEDVPRTAKLARPVPLEQPTDLGNGIELRLVEAGHLLGSAMVTLKFKTSAGERTITFTGDLGRRGVPILRDPAPVPPGDLLISESTYGGRTHPSPAELADQLADIVKRTSDRGGNLLIPAFAVGRTQTVIYYLHQLMVAGRLPNLPIYVDSPLATAATEVFLHHPECYDDETTQLLKRDPDLFGHKRVQYVRTVEESKRLNDRREPCIIIASSGMCESGRILHHLKHNIQDSRTTVLLIGYQAPNTLGERLARKQSPVRILDHMFPVQAEVVLLSGFSGHADQNELLTAFAPLAGKVRKVCLVHGEDESADALAAALRQKGFADVAVPERGEEVPV
jgi:metallo-beta-lactamase family protein